MLQFSGFIFCRHSVYVTDANNNNNNQQREYLFTTYNGSSSDKINTELYYKNTKINVTIELN